MSVRTPVDDGKLVRLRETVERLTLNPRGATVPDLCLLLEVADAYLTLQSPPARVLKPLVWHVVQSDGITYHCGSSPFGGGYDVFADGKSFVWMNGPGKKNPCDSIEHGKQLCEADYRERVEALFEKGGE